MSRVTDKALRVALEQSKGYVDRTRPKSLSELENDNHTVVDAGYVHTDNNYTDSDKTKLASAASAMANKVDKEAGKGLSSEDFTAALKAKLEALSNYDDSAIQAKANALQEQLDTLTSGETSKVIETFNAIEELLKTVNDTETLTGLLQEQKTQSEQYVKDNAVLRTEQSLTEAEQAQVLENLGNPQMRLFIDQWNTAWGSYGKYDPANAPDPQHPFMGNDIWMTYEEAIGMMSFYRKLYNPPYVACFACYPYRTVVPIVCNSINSMSYMFQDASEPEVLHMEGVNTRRLVRPNNISWMFDGCKALRRIDAIFDIAQVTNANFAFRGCTALEDIRIEGMKVSLSFAQSPLLSLASLQYLVANAANTKAITITVHADVYAKLTDESNTEWYQVLTDAQAKNINFAIV